MPKSAFRQSLSLPGLLKKVRRCFKKIPDTKPNSSIPLTDPLMSGMAVFGLKYPSLLQFDPEHPIETSRSNLKRLYGIEKAPCDTYFRERLETVEPQYLRQTYTCLFRALQRGKGREGFDYLEGYYLLSIDGTGYFSSLEVHCEQCCEKHHRDGQVTYPHQLLGAVLVHPEHKEVFPRAPEPMIKQEGTHKNDCERNAAKRLLKDVRREHPPLKLIVIEDGLASNGPHITLLKELNYHFILGAKTSDPVFLFDWVDKIPGTLEYELTDKKGVHHRFPYHNGAPLNDANFELKINFPEYWETKPSGKVTHFSWVTDIPITEANLMKLMRGARARWKIENETFNTLKNHGYHFEHNFGHGHQHLSTVRVHLMMLAFLIDPVQQRCCHLFKRAVTEAKSKRRFWRKVLGLFQHFRLPDWETWYGVIAYGMKPVTPELNDTS